jgi:hypothetical protein
MSEQNGIELIDPYASFCFGAQEDTGDTVKSVKKEAISVGEGVKLTSYSASDIYNAINTTKKESHKVTIVSTLSMVDPMDPDHIETLIENTVEECVVYMQRRADTVQLKFKFPALTDNVYGFWNVFEEYGKKAEENYDTSSKVPVALIYIVPHDNPNIFMSVQDPWFWSLQAETPGGITDQIRLFVPMKAVEFGANNIDQEEIEREVVEEIRKDTQRITQENELLKKEIEKLEEQLKAEETMDHFDDDNTTNFDDMNDDNNG